MTFEDYRALDGVALSEALQRREIAPAQAMDLAIEAAEAVDRHCNAITYPRYDAARAEAAQKDTKPGAFHGVPFLLKDSGLPATDLPSSIGSRLFEETRYTGDATLVQRFRDAGFINFARTTVPEFCMAPTTEARRNGGPTRNPFDLSRSAGGSSGGAAVAVAAGVVPVAHGSDGGGSIRIPASCCGIYGLKPSRGLVPMGPFRGEGWGGLACDGVLSRSVRDTARVLDLVGGMEPGAPYASPGWNTGFETLVQALPATPMRIGLWRDPFGQPVETSCIEAVEAAAEECRALGHEIEEISPPSFDYDAFIGAIITIMSVNVTQSVETKLAQENRPPREDELEPALLDAFHRGQETPAADYVRAINLVHATGRMMDRMMGGCDLLLSPSLTSPPVKLGTISTDVPDFAAFRRKAGELTAFLAVINASGQPAASLPLWRHEGLPVGVQVTGRFGRDDQVLALSAQLEQADLWRQAQAWPRFEA
jgi:amidase